MQYHRMGILVACFITSVGCFPPPQINENKHWAKKIGGGVSSVVEWTLKQEHHIAYGQGMGALVHLAFKSNTTEEQMYEAFRAIKDARSSGWRIRPATPEDVPYLAQPGYEAATFPVEYYFWSRFYDCWARVCLAFPNSLQLYNRLAPDRNAEGNPKEHFDFYMEYHIKGLKDDENNR